MEIKQIRELMAAMGRHGMRRLSYKKDDFELSLEREGEEVIREVHRIAPVEQVMRQDPAIAKPLPKADAAAPAEPAKEEGAVITSPMVGTFYSSASPEDPPFVKVGDKVSEDTVVGIVEAMKVMNEVKAGVSGTVSEILVENSHPVEFGTKLFRICPE